MTVPLNGELESYLKENELLDIFKKSLDENGLFSSSYTAMDETNYTIPPIKPRELIGIVGIEGFGSILKQDNSKLQHYKAYEEHVEQQQREIEIQKSIIRHAEEDVARSAGGPLSHEEMLRRAVKGTAKRVGEEPHYKLSDNGMLSISATNEETGEVETIEKDAASWIGEYGLNGIKGMLQTAALTINEMLTLKENHQKSVAARQANSQKEQPQEKQEKASKKGTPPENPEQKTETQSQTTTDNTASKETTELVYDTQYHKGLKGEYGEVENLESELIVGSDGKEYLLLGEQLDDARHILGEEGLKEAIAGNAVYVAKLEQYSGIDISGTDPAGNSYNHRFDLTPTSEANAALGREDDLRNLKELSPQIRLEVLSIKDSFEKSANNTLQTATEVTFGTSGINTNKVEEADFMSGLEFDLQETSTIGPAAPAPIATDAKSAGMSAAGR